jgi:hypothetical protein
MQFFTTEMVFMHPPRTFAGHYASPRRRRYGCRTMPRIAVPPVETHVKTQASPASAEASTCVDEAQAQAQAQIIDEAA